MVTQTGIELGVGDLPIDHHPMHSDLFLWFLLSFQKFDLFFELFIQLEVLRLVNVCKVVFFINEFPEN